MDSSEAAPVSIAPDESGLAEALLRTESLGDNCEFGIAQRHFGMESGQLFRWTTSTLPGLIKLFESDFSGLYEFDNIIANPNSRNMIIDAAYGIGFHSGMHSQKGEFLLDEAARRSIHDEEIIKITRRLDRLRERLTDPETIFVYKSTGAAAVDGLEKLRAAVRAQAACHLLCVEKTADAAQVGTVEDQGNGLLMGRIGAFAPWHSVTPAHIALHDWRNIVLAAVALISA